MRKLGPTRYRPGFLHGYAPYSGCNIVSTHINVYSKQMDLIGSSSEPSPREHPNSPPEFVGCSSHWGSTDDPTFPRLWAPSQWKRRDPLRAEKTVGDARQLRVTTTCVTSIVRRCSLRAAMIDRNMQKRLVTLWEEQMKHWSFLGVKSRTAADHVLEENLELFFCVDFSCSS